MAIFMIFPLVVFTCSFVPKAISWFRILTSYLPGYQDLSLREPLEKPDPSAIPSWFK